MGQQLLAIDMGSSKIKLVVGTASKWGLRIKQSYYANTPPDAIINGEIIDVNRMKEALSKTVKDFKLGGKPTVLTVKTGAFISREFALPPMNEKDVEQALRIEVERAMPIDMTEYVLSYRELETVRGNALDNDSDSEDETDEGDGTKKPKRTKKPPKLYMVGLIPSRIVSTYYSVLKNAGLNPVYMDINSNAIEKFINLGKNKFGAAFEKYNIVLVADIGSDMMDMTVFENGIPRVNRTVPTGGAEVTQNIARVYDTGYDEAETIKTRIVNLVNSDPYSEMEYLGVNDVVKSVVSDWVEQLRRMVEFYMSRSKGASVDCICIYGGSSEMNGLEDYLSDVFGIRAYVLPVPSNVKQKNAVRTGAHTYFNAMGAIIRR